jgi:hypothetical protein
MANKKKYTPEEAYQRQLKRNREYYWNNRKKRLQQIKLYDVFKRKDKKQTK